MPAQHSRELKGNLPRKSMALPTRLLTKTGDNEQIGAERYENSNARLDHRDGCRERDWETRAVTLPRVPRRGGWVSPLGAIAVPHTDVVATAEYQGL
jgi:hypothetical protein